MAKNEFLPFGTAGGSNVLTPTAYGQLAARSVGFAAGVAKSKELNTVWRQASVIAATVAQFIANRSGDDVLDDGNMTKLQASLEKALKAKIDEEGVVRSVNNHGPGANGDVKLGTAADADIGTSTGNAIGVGGFGLASSLTAQPDVDLDALKNFGFYIVRNATNAPINDVGVLYVSVQSWNSGSGGDANRAVQTAYSYTNKNRAFCRTYFGPSSGWSGWAEFFSEAHKPTSADVDLGNVGNFMAVQQGGVSNQGDNKLHIGWGTDGKLRLTVDQSDQGLIFTTNSPPPYPVTSVNGHAGAVSLNDGFSTDNTSMWWDAFSSQLRIQVGTWSIGAPAGASTTVAFPKAFPNWCLFAVPVPDSSVASSAATEQIGVGGRTNTTVTFTKGIGDSSARGGKYLAFGF